MAGYTEGPGDNRVYEAAEYEGRRAERSVMAAPRDRASIMDALQNAFQEVEMTHASFDNLAGRISPVLGPGPVSGQSDQKMSPSDQSDMMGGMIRLITNIQALRSRIVDITECIEL